MTGSFDWEAQLMLLVAVRPRYVVDDVVLTIPDILSCLELYHDLQTPMSMYLTHPDR